MCGHAVIALGRYAVDNRLIPEERITSPEIQVNIECPCGLVIAYVEYNDGQTGRVKFHSVPSFAFALDVKVDVPDYGQLVVDIGYGGAFYAIISAQKVGLDVTKSRTVDLIDAATKISEAVRGTVQLNHPDSKDLSFLYGTVLTDGQDKFDVDIPTNNTCVFADREVDRSPTGSGVSARVAVQHARGQIVPGQVRTFRSGVNGSEFTGEVYKTTTCGSVKDSNQRDAVVVRVSGKANYTGTSCFTLEADDMYQQGFLPR